MLLEPTEEQQSYIEDCEVCCRPIQVQHSTDLDFAIKFQAFSIEQ